MALTALVVDLGYILVAQSDLQRAADAAAHAAVLEFRSNNTPDLTSYHARKTASHYVRDNQIIHRTATVEKNWFNANPDGDLLIGRVDFESPGQPMVLTDSREANAIRVRIRRNSDRNGELALFFARALNRSSAALQAEATAAIIRNVGGFKITATEENVPLLPITMAVSSWESEVSEGKDQWAWDPESRAIQEEGDGVPEVVIFPSTNGTSGNLGTLNIGTSANGNPHIAKQIRKGLSQADLDFHGGELKLDDQGELHLSGNPGLSASLQKDLRAIAGEPRVIPLYRQVSGSGASAVFVITKFVGVRVMSVNLSGGNKFVSVQPANVTYKGVLQSQPGLVDTSEDIYSPPVIFQ